MPNYVQILQYCLLIFYNIAYLLDSTKMGYVKCCVPGCHDKISRSHRFPNPKKDMGRFRLWLEVINTKDLLAMDPLYLYSVKKICHRHFEGHFYSEGCTRLHINAIPTLNLPSK